MSTSVVVRNWIRLFLWLLLAAMVSPAAHAWTSDGKALWPDGTVKLNLRLGEGPVYTDGATPNSAAKSGVLQWNKYMKRVQVEVSSQAAGIGAEADNANDVFFASSWQGVILQKSVQALTIVRTSGSVRVEVDIVVNSSLTWGSYQGDWLPATADLGRVIAHEVGHVLGLGSSDMKGVSGVYPLMHGDYTRVASPQVDDIEGIANLYGAAPGFEPIIPQIGPQSPDTSVELLARLEIFVYYPESSYTFQWYKDGVAIAGATKPNYVVAAAQNSDAGVYFVEVTGLSGSSRGKDIKVTITPRRSPTAGLTSFTALNLYETQQMNLQATGGGSTPKTFQWQKDGVDTPGATGLSYGVPSVTLADAGVYRVIVKNDVGSAISPEITISVRAIVAPFFATKPEAVVALQEGASRSVTFNISPPVASQWQLYREGVLLSTATTGDAVVALPYASRIFSFLGLETEAGRYSLKITNVAGAMSFDFAITIAPKPQISGFSVSDSVALCRVGGSFNCAFSYPDRLLYTNTFQWYKDGKVLVGQTGESLVLTAVTYADAGEYSVLITNEQGSVMSPSRTLRVYSSDTTSLVRPVVYSGIAYLLQSSPAAVLRFDLSTGKVLSALSLPSVGTQLCVGSAGVFVGTAAAEIYRCPLGSSAFTLLRKVGTGVQALATLDDKLFWLSDDYQLVSLKLSTGDVFSTTYTSSRGTNCSILVSASSKTLTVFNDSQLYSSPRPQVWNYSIGDTDLSPTTSTMSVFGWALYMAPTGKSLLCANGYIYDQASLVSKGGNDLGVEAYTALDGEQSLLLSGGRIYRLDGSLMPLQSMPAPEGTVGLCAAGGIAYTLQRDAQNAIVYASLSLAGMQDLFQKSVALDKVLPSGIPDLHFVDKNDLLWMISRGQRSLVAWSPTSNTVVKAIQLRGIVSMVAYSAENHCAYLSYSDEYITVVDLSKVELSEAFFAKLSLGSYGLAAAGPVVLTNPQSLVSYDAQGHQLAISNEFHMELGVQNVWDAASQRLYGLSAAYYETAPVNLFSYAVSSTGVATGTYVTSMAEGLHIAKPVRLGGGGLLLGSGQFCELPGMTLKTSLPTAHVDAQYVKGAWFTLNSTMEGALVNKWDPTLGSVIGSVALPGHPVALYPLSGDRLLVLTNRFGAPRFIVLDSNLGVQSTTGPAKPGRLANLSVQADAGQGMDALVPGFVINGTTPKMLLIRGSGPGLAAFGVPNCLVDPTITLYNQSGAVLDTNDNWGTLSAQRELSQRSADVYAFTLAPGSKDAVLLSTLTPGAYSAQVQGTNKGEGRALVEIYDADEAPGDSRAVNMSARCKISKDHEAVGGFVIQGDKPMKLLIRAVGPGLIKYSVRGTSADPKLRVFSGSTVIAENNDWSADATKAAALRAAFASTGAFVLDAGSKDAALLVELQPGSYTVYMESADGGSGVSILEFYEVD